MNFVRRYQAELWVAVGVLVLVLTVGLLLDESSDPVVSLMHQHLGAEYYNIGRAIADGRGFSDPFGEQTGPTAWMPPLYPYLIAGLLRLTGSRWLTSVCILGLMDLALVLGAVAVFAVARRVSRRVSPLLSVLIYLIWIVIFNEWTFFFTQDIWLIWVGVSLVLLLSCHYVSTARASAARWGALGGFASLVSPALFTGWSLLVATFLVRDRRRKKWLGALAVAFVVSLPWVTRNAVVFHQFIPVKSNLYYDAYQANYVDDDGVYDLKSMSGHPFCEIVERFKYARMGEVGYLADYKRVFYAAVRAQPTVLVRKIGFRALAAFIFYVPIEREPPAILMLKRVVYPLPFLSALALLFLGGSIRRFVRCLTLFCLTFIAPYVLVAFYIRYLLPLSPVLVLFVYCAVDRGVARLCSKNALAHAITRVPRLRAVEIRR